MRIRWIWAGKSCNQWEHRWKFLMKSSLFSAAVAHGNFLCGRLVVLVSWSQKPLAARSSSLSLPSRRRWRGLSVSVWRGLRVLGGGCVSSAAAGHSEEPVIYMLISTTAHSPSADGASLNPARVPRERRGFCVTCALLHELQKSAFYSFTTGSFTVDSSVSSFIRVHPSVVGGSWTKALGDPYILFAAADTDRSLHFVDPTFVLRHFNICVILSCDTFFFFTADK